jgi:uncharacterized protein YndB with AHSA1/START domain
MSEQTVTATDTEFTITRTLQAPLATVWENWTGPEHFEHWFHAKPGSVDLDVRTGGRWRATMVTPDGEMEMGGVYGEVIDHEKLVWTMDGPGEPVVMRATLSERDGETVAVYGQNIVGDYSCDQMIADATGILDSFEDYLGKVGAATS